VVEQRYLAVREVLDGAKITDVGTRHGASSMVETHSAQGPIDATGTVG